ncbi:CHAT domain-containing protein [Actinoplanes sp. HUAS TT8]|uniref:CHAT domain-containing protein n=1 Tax=Actinoplanes sp. HUAS TT8 TaxID=3447453 RepID=UPI003F521858
MSGSSEPDEFPAVLGLVKQAYRDGDTPALAQAVQRLVGLTDLDTAPADRAGDLGDALYWLADRTGDARPLLAAERAYRAAVAGGALHRRTHLGLCLVRESESLGRSAALDEALPLLRSAAEDRPGNVAAHANLVLGLMRQLERTGDVTLLPEALVATRTAGEAARLRPSAGAQVLSNSSSILMAAWELTGDREQLDAAVEAARAACALVPAGDPAVPGCAAALLRALLDRAAVTGDRTSAAQAARRLRRSMRTMAPDDPDRPIYLHQIAIAGRTTFSGTGDLDALDEAIRDWAEAIRLLPAGHPDRAAYRANRAGALRNRFETVADVAALDEAVRELEDVVAATAPGDRERSTRLAALGNALHRQGVQAGDREVLARAAGLLRDAAAMLSPDRPEHREHRTNLGAVLLAAAQLGPSGADPQEAIDVLTEATAGAGPDDPALANSLLNLGHAWELQGGADGLRRAAEAYRTLLDTEVAAALSRAMAAQSLGHLYVREREWSFAREALGRAVQLLDLVAWAGLGRDDQERLLTQFPGLATTAAACALELDDLDGAVEILEQGRGVLYAQALSRSAGTEQIRARAPGLARRLGAAHDLIESTHRGDGPAVWDRHDAVRERDAVLAEIHRVEGLERFLRPPRLDGLRAGLGDGTAVIVNVAAHRCDALLVTATSTRHVRLPALTDGDIRRYAVTALQPTDAGLTEMLEWLWDTVAEPVLQQVNPGAHLWWIPTGALSFLPLHAAGYDEPGRSVPDRVVSSFAPTLHSLAAIGGPAAAVSTTVIAPSPLPATRREAHHVHHRLGPGSDLVTEKDASVARVRDLLADADWVHFAGHATADPARPSDSHLALHDGSLRIRDLLKDQAGVRRTRTLAYLSACSTLQGGPRLPDENIHIAAALCLAGFADVVATSWPVPDAVAVRAARLFYDGLSTGSPARAVNAVTRALRRRYPRRPTCWAAYVHVGADFAVTLPTG